jgi:DNA repair protein RadC
VGDELAGKRPVNIEYSKMYMPIAPSTSSQERIERNVTTLFGARTAQILSECNGRATNLIDMLRFKSGRGWDALRAARELHEVALLEQMTERTALTDPAATERFLKHYLASRPFESFIVIMLDNRHRCIAVRDLFRGTIDGASVHPREVIREVLEHNAAAVIFAHNHPSGVAEASQADELITRRLRDSCALVDVRVLDHVIVAGDKALSFAARGLL